MSASRERTRVSPLGRAIVGTLAVGWMAWWPVVAEGTAGDCVESTAAGREVERWVLESGAGVVWEPVFPLEIAELESAFTRSIRDLKLLEAPFNRPASGLVTLEALAWTVLAELAHARSLYDQAPQRALGLMRLAARQIGFAQRELLEPRMGLYKPRWSVARAQAEGDFKPIDQWLMLWALSAYSLSGELLGSAQRARIFLERTRLLADGLAQVLHTTDFAPDPYAEYAEAVRRWAQWAYDALSNGSSSTLKPSRGDLPQPHPARHLPQERLTDHEDVAAVMARLHQQLLCRTSTTAEMEGTTGSTDLRPTSRTVSYDHDGVPALSKGEQAGAFWRLTSAPWTLAEALLLIASLLLAFSLIVWILLAPSSRGQEMEVEDRV